MSRQKEREDLFEDPFDSPLRYNHPQFGPSNGLCSPCHYIRSSIRSKSIFLKKSPQNQQNNTTKKTKVNKSYINDFDGQIQIQQYIFSNNNKSKSIHESLSSLFKENKIDARYEEPKEESSLVNYLQAIQQLMQELESNVGNLERKLNLNQQRIQEPIIQCNNHQLVYINQNVQGLVGRIQYILMQKNLLPDRPQPNPDENQIQLNFNRDLKKYKCQFCPLRFIKACSLGGHISRVHKEESKQSKSTIPAKKNKHIKKEKKNQSK
ncbi:unnamed protein product [Paramecium octaurelia]|uniref:C2H2-type domain-containing protein n=1 Tax=Paramecium octaurelia TaxID=43137 RepID=A0A8S1UHE9_PAROT|nr:unnamed protein product [Paramecium octaurelia]